MPDWKQSKERRPTVRGVLFDKDGTLIDFRQSWTPAYRGLTRALAAAAEDLGLADQLLRRLGYDPVHAAYAEESPLLWATTARLAELWAAMPELAGIDVAGMTFAHLGDELRYPPVPVGDLGRLFAALRARGLVLGMATMDTTDNARALAHRLALLPHLPFIAGYDAGHGAKPGPGMVTGFCAATGLLPAEVAVVGDTLADLAMARAAGAGLAVAVLTGALPAAALAPSADLVLPDILGLEAALDALGALPAP